MSKDCEDCGWEPEAPGEELRPWKYEPEVKLCESCYENRMDEEE